MAGLDFSNLPTLSGALGLYPSTPAPAPPPGTPTGDGNLVTSALGSGVYGTLASVAQGGEAVARAAGFQSAADAAAAFAQRQRDTALTYATPQNEAASFFSPRGFAYRTLQGLPSLAGIAGGAALATIGAPEEAAAGVLGAGARALLGGTAAAFPGAVGENIQRARTENQPVDQGTALKALALGLPEAGLQAALPVMGEGMIAGRIAARGAPALFGSEYLGSKAVGAAAGAAVNAPAAAAGEALMQQMGDPNRSLADRSQDIVNAALSGGAQGAFFGGLLHSVAKKPPANVTNDDLLRITSDPLGLPPSPTPQLPPPGAPGTEARLEPPQRFPPGPPGASPAPPDVAVTPAQPEQAIRQLEPPHRFPPVPEPASPAPPNVIVPPAPPLEGELIRPQPTPLLPPPSLEPASRPFSGEVIQAGGPADRGISGLLPPPEPDVPDGIARPISGQPIVGRQLYEGELVRPQPPAGPWLLGVDPRAEMARNERVSRPASDDDPVITPPPSADDPKSMSGAQLLSALDTHGPANETGQKILSEIGERLKGVDLSNRDPRDVLVQQDTDRAKAQVADQQTQQIKKATRGFLPDFLKPHLGDDNAVKGAIFDEAQARDQAEKPLGTRLTAIAKSFGVMDDQGKLIDPRADQEQVDTARATEEANQAETTNLGPNPDVPSRVMLDGIPEAHQDKWKALEALRKDAPQEFVSKIDDLQSRLAKPKRGEAGQIVSDTAKLRKAIEGQKAVDAVRAPEDKAPKAAPPPVDETQGAKKFSEPTSEAKPPEPPPAPVKKQDQLKAKQRGKADAVQERGAAPVSGKEPPQGGGRVRGKDAQGQETAGKVEAPGRAEVPSEASQAQIEPKAASAVAKALKDVRGNLGDLMNQELPRTSRVVKEKKVFESDAGLAKRNEKYQDALGALDRAQAAVSKALKSGDPRELAKIGDKHFDSKAYDDFYDQLSPKGQKLLDEHVQKVDALIDAVKEASGKNYTLTSDTAYASRDPTAHDQVISGLIDNGASARQVLEHIARNGSNSIRRTMAARLLQRSKENPTLRFGSLDEMTKDHPTLRNVAGDYHSGFDAIRIFDKADLEHTMLHEFEHAATTPALESDPAIKAEAQKLHDAAKAQMTPEEAAHPSMANPAEMIAEARANPDFANLLDSMKGPKGSIWQSIKDLVRRLFGYPKGAESLLDHVESLAGQAADVTNNMRSIQGIEHVTGLYARAGTDALNKFAREAERMADPRGIPTRIARWSNFWRNLDGIAVSYGRWLPSLTNHVQNIRDMHNYVESLVGPHMAADNMERALDKRSAAMLADLKNATFSGLDPRRTMDKHTWLTDTQRQKLAPELKRLNELWNQAKRGDAKVATAYELSNNANRMGGFSNIVAQGVNVVRRSKAFNLTSNPIEDFHNDTSGMKNDPRQAANFWQTKLTGPDGLLPQVRAKISEVTQAMKAEPDADKRAALKASIADLRSWETLAARHVAASSQAPNFPSRRYGDHYTSFDLSPNFGEKEAGQLRKMLDDAGFHNANIDHNIDNNSAYIRVDGVGASADLDRVIKAAEKLDLVKWKSSGETSGLYKQPGLLPSHLAGEIKAFRDAFPLMDETGPDGDRGKAYNEQVKAQLDQMHQSLMDLLPDSNVSKLFAVRENVQGMSSDMRKASLDRGMTAARSASQMFMFDRMNAARKGLKDEVEGAKRDPNMDAGMKDRIQSAANEAFLRNAQQTWKTAVSPFEKLRHLTHLFELGLSVPYALTLHTQSWTLGHAELVKHFGGVRSMQALVGAHPMAFKIMKAAFSGNDKFGFVLTPQKMRAAGIDDKTIQFITKVQNQGAFNTSKTQWVYDGLHHHEGIMRNLHDVSGGWTLYSEMLPRIVQALAAKDLYEERASQGKAPVGKDWNDVHSFATSQVNNSQFSWLPDLNPRAFGKQGVAGPASPLIAQFQGFRAKMLEKLHREFADAFGARGDEFKGQARRYLVSHLAAQTILAGTMGLPFVGMFAGAYDRLADLITGDHTHDLKASYRGWLSQTFGPGMGEALAHGVPRFGGIDLGSHLGEDRILPLTDLMASKQKMEDEIKDQAFKMSGSAAHLAANVALGGRDLMNGDVIEGLTKMLPETFKNIAEAGMISKYGYTDKAGFQYPGGGPSTQDVVAKGLGFSPSDEANYEEKAHIASDIRTRQEYDTQNVQQHLAKAFNRQDPQAYVNWLAASNQYMLSHPGLMPPVGGFENYLREHMQSAALAGALGTPLGVSPRDFLTRGMVSFGNGGDR